MKKPTYLFTVSVPYRPQIAGRAVNREDFYSWVWSQFSSRGLLGIHEGTVLTEQASRDGFESESWTVDSGEAPRERDWIGTQSFESAAFYFESEKQAQAVAKDLAAQTGLKPGLIKIQKAQDWDAEWKASFRGVSVSPFWEVRPPWVDEPVAQDKKLLKLNPGAGFGTGTHETTQLCLKAMGELSEKKPLAGLRVLDFGSGSGILSIGAALLGAEVDAVEIDPLANENASENAKLNGIENRISISPDLPEASCRYDLVIANILRPVLVEFAPRLTSHLAPGGTLILSGLIERDVAEVSTVYGALLAGSGSPRVEALNEWRALIF